MEELRVASWTELIDRMYEASWHPAHGRFRSPYVFRGLPDYRFDRRTSLCRLGGEFADVEDDLLRNFRKYAHRSESPGNSWWNWLALAQHHGLPTRLLDWTFSPFVALHFVTSKHDLFQTDGVVWCINFMELKRFLPEPLVEILNSEGAAVFTASMSIVTQVPSRNWIGGSPSAAASASCSSSRLRSTSGSSTNRRCSR